MQVVNYIFNYRNNKIEYIEIMLKYNGIFRTVSVERNKLEFWLLINSKLGWKINKREAQVFRIEELEGTMSYKEYWKMENDLIFSDLLEYCEKEQVEYKGIVYSKNTKNISYIFNQ